MTKENLLVTLADKNYIKQAKQLFSSVYWNAGWKGDYMLLAHEIPEKELRWFRKKGILVKKCKPLYNKKIGKDKHPGVVVTKFYLFTPEFKKWKNIIYLDADIIVRASLDELTKVKGFAAVRDLYLDKLEKQFKRTYSDLENKYNFKKNSFNAGVLVFNTGIIKEDTYKKMKNLFEKYVNFFNYGEQTALNLFFYDNWKKLPLVYNLCFESFKICYKKIPRDAITFHFSGINKLNKPWHPENPFYKEWKNNLERAELIDLNNIPEGKKWSRFEIYKYSFCFKKKGVFYTFLKRQKNNFIYLLNTPDRLLGKFGIFLKKHKNTPDRLLGKFGIFLKKHNAGLYYKLKRIEKKIRR